METARIKSITYLGKEDVYNMEVKDHHNFSVNGGLIVHNCYDSVGYGIIFHHAKYSKGLPTELPLIAKHKQKAMKGIRSRRMGIRR